MACPLLRWARALPDNASLQGSLSSYQASDRSQESYHVRSCRSSRRLASRALFRAVGAGLAPVLVCRHVLSGAMYEGFMTRPPHTRTPQEYLQLSTSASVMHQTPA